MLWLAFYPNSMTACAPFHLSNPPRGLWVAGPGAQVAEARLVLRSTGSPATASLSFPVQSLRFRVRMRARFVSLGSADDSTADKSVFRIVFESDAPSSPTSGAVLTFLRDRFNPEPLYKVVRTDSAWHEWVFDVDTAAGTIASSRDGLPVALHAFPMRPPSGVRVELRGAVDLPGHVEIADFRWEAWSGEAHATAVSRQKIHKAQPYDWPVWRRDNRNSAVVPGTHDLRGTRMTSRIPVPGGTPPDSLSMDLDSDGVPELLVAGNGKLEAFRPDGRRLWTRRLENPVVWGLYDLDGDGRGELLVAGGAPGRLHVCNPETGETRYVSPFREKYGVAGIKVGKLIPDSRGLQVVVWGHLDDTGVVIRFDDGVEKARLAWTFHWKQTFFTPLVALADMRRTGHPDLVVVTYNHAFVFSGTDGSLRMQHEWPSGRNYGSLVVTDIDNDGYPDIVVLADVLREHVAVLRNNSGRGLSVLWDKFTEQNYPDDHASLRVVTEGVADLDGDGKIEIGWSLFDDRVDGRWRTFVVDALTGNVKKVLPDRWLAGVVPAHGARLPSLLVSRPGSRERLNESQLFVHDPRSGRETALPEGRVVSGATMAEHPSHCWSQVSGVTTGLPTRALSAPAPVAPLALASSKSSDLHLLEFEPSSPPSGSRMAHPEGVSVRHIDTRRKTWTGVGRDGRLVWSSRGERPIVLPTVSGSIVQPVVGRLRRTEAPHIVFVDPKQTVHCVSGDTLRTLWSLPGRGIHSFYIPQSRPGGIPVLADVDGDGDQEVLVSRGKTLVALAADGAVRRTWRFPGPPMLWNVGDFLGEGNADLAVAWERGAVLDMETCLVSGRSGKVVWRAHGGNGPLAVSDIDRDGRDDMVTRDLYERRTWSGRTGRDLKTVEMLAGYHTPILAAGDFSGIWWVGGSWATGYDSADGKQAWSHPLSPSGTGCVADVDGDGNLEVAGVTFGNIYALPVLQPVAGPDRELLCWDARTGTQRWSFPLSASTGGIVAADIDGDRNPEFAMGLADGRVIAVGAGGTLRWERNVPASAGVPVVADVDGDGRVECLVPCADGHLYVFGGGQR